MFGIQKEYYNGVEMHTFRTNSVKESEKYLAILTIVLHFPLPKERVLDFGVFFFTELLFPEFLFEGPITTSKLHIDNCNFRFREEIPTPGSTKEWHKLSLISPIDTDSIAPCTCHK